LYSLLFFVGGEEYSILVAGVLFGEGGGGVGEGKRGARYEIN